MTQICIHSLNTMITMRKNNEVLLATPTCFKQTALHTKVFQHTQVSHNALLGITCHVKVLTHNKQLEPQISFEK